MSQPFVPYVPDDDTRKEFTFVAILTGAFLGLIFAASSLYLVLKVGMTVSASIPVAVLAMTFFRIVAKVFPSMGTTILENNIIQTTGSAGESIAFGVGVTMPALMLLGFEMDLTRVMVVSIFGGLLGILAMIPLRRAFIVRMHGRPGQPGTLLYPEGTACAQVLISGEKGGAAGITVFFGFLIAFAHKFVTEGAMLLRETVDIPLRFINKAANVSTAMASELLGVGYIIGLRTSAIMMGGALMGYVVLIPLIFFIGEHATKIIAPGKKLIGDMSITEIRNSYLLFIGAGCVATAGIISMLKTLPMILKGFKFGGGGGGDKGPVRRTENDLPMSVVGFGSLVLVSLFALFLTSEVGWVSAIAGALLVVVFGFLFVTVSSRLTGELGSSSNPISGMTTATLMLTCLIFLALGWTSAQDRVLALSIAAVVCIASSNGGTTAQSLKTGFLVGGTPRKMQFAILIGAFVSSIVIGATLLAFNRSGAIYTSKAEYIAGVRLEPSEIERLSETHTYRGTVYKIYDTKGVELKEAKKGETYAQREAVATFPEGRFLIDGETGRAAYRIDYAIMGQLKTDDNGNPVKREFDAPKTQVMGLVLNGVLKGDLNWTMVGIGAMIAILLELCGISSLTFAVGLYVPIQYSTPIFLGGIARWLVDKKYSRETDRAVARARNDEERATASLEGLRRSETSPGVLLASGLIAGGSIAGMLVAFANFDGDIVETMQQYQHEIVLTTSDAPYGRMLDDVARTRYPDDRHETERKAFVKEIDGLNIKLLGKLDDPEAVEAAKGTKAIAAGTKIDVPRANLAETIAAFVAMILLLLLVGLGIFSRRRE